MFEFATAQRIIFGLGSREQLPAVVAGFGRRLLLVTGSSGTRAEDLKDQLVRSGCQVEPFLIGREPTVQDVQGGVSLARTQDCELVLGLGGGSAMDAAKAIAALVRAPGDLLDYLEVVGRGQALPAAGIPCIAVPTTAGTGAEVTRNAVIDVPEHSTKVSLRGASVLPRVALVDPELMLSVPSNITAFTGFDALTQVIEPFLSTRANAITDALAKEGIGLASAALRRACDDGADKKAREDMAMVSLLGGLCLTNAGLGAVHGLAGPIGGMCQAPHGAVCAALLANTMAANLKAVQGEERANRDGLLGRFREVGRLLTKRPDATAEDAIHWLGELTLELRIPRLGSYGLTRNQVGSVVASALRASSMQYNPVRLSASALEVILEQSL